MLFRSVSQSRYWWMHPVASGFEVVQKFEARHAVAISFTAAKKTAISLDLSLASIGKDPVDYKPVLIAPPDTMRVPMEVLVRRTVADHLSAMGYDPSDELEDELEMPFDDGESDFGEGFAEPDDFEPVSRQSDRVSARKSDKSGDAGADARVS